VVGYARPIVVENADDPPGDRVLTVMRANGSTPSPENGEIWTYATWWSSRGPESPHAVSRVQIAKVRVAIAILRAGNDDLLLHVVTQADNMCTGSRDVVSDMAAAWLANVA